MRWSLKIIAALAVATLLATVWLKYRSGSGNESEEARLVRAASRRGGPINIASLRDSRQPGTSGNVPINPTLQANVTNTTNTAASPVPGTLLTDWEEAIDGILADESDDDVRKSSKLLALLPRLPEDGQIEAITHAANLLDDAHYTPLRQLVTNASTSEDVLDVLMSDLANRTNSLKLPTFLQIARQEKHPLAGEAKNLLKLYLDEDYGSDWVAWEKGVQHWLKEEREGSVRPE